MNRKVIWYSFILIILTIIVVKNDAWSYEEINIHQGELDLSHTRVTHIGPFHLNGEWEFYWRELLTPGDVSQNKVYVNVPNSWVNYEENYDRYGFATYRLVIHFNQQDIGQLFSLYIPNIATAYRLWVNDELMAANGVVRPVKEEMVPQSYPKVSTFRVDEEKLEIVIQVSNFHQRKSGIWESIILGTEEQILDLREKNIVMQGFVIGCIFMIGFYQLALYFQLRRRLAFLFLAIACFGIAIRTSLLRDVLILKLFPSLSWEFAVHIEYLSALIALLCFLIYVKLELFLPIPNRLLNTFVILLLLFSMLVLTTPPSIFTNAFFILQGIVFVTMLTIVVASLMNIKRKAKESYLHFIAMIVLFIAILNDLLFYSQKVFTNEFVSFGLLFYLFTQTIYLAGQFSKSFHKAENLSKDLQKLNESLEKKVAERTEELEQTNKKLLKLEHSRKRLFANVSHELKTPLTFIQGYIKAMIDGVIPRNDASYLRSIYRDTQIMEQVIIDLQELSKFDSGQVDFQFRIMEMRTFFKQLYEEQKLWVKEKGIQLHYKEPSESFHIECRIDPVRMKQAFMNLLVNAKKHTPAGGDIFIELKNNEKNIQINIRDTGRGIAESDIPFIFDRFYKAANGTPTHNTKRGAGLGLSIAKEIIEYHGGEIGVQSKEGKSSMFYFQLPIYQIKQSGKEEVE